MKEGYQSILLMKDGIIERWEDSSAPCQPEVQTSQVASQRSSPIRYEYLFSAAYILFGSPPSRYLEGIISTEEV